MLSLLVVTSLSVVLSLVALLLLIMVLPLLIILLLVVVMVEVVVVVLLFLLLLPRHLGGRPCAKKQGACCSHRVRVMVRFCGVVEQHPVVLTLLC